MGSLLAVLITLFAALLGFRLISLPRAGLSVSERVCAGAVVGLALLAWIGFLTALLGGLSAATVAITIAVMVAIWVALERVIPTRETFVELRSAFRQVDRTAAIYYGLWAGLLVWLFSRVVILQDGAFETAPANNYGDLPFHLSVITSFAWGDNFPPSNPIFAGARFTYPFLIDFLTAFFLRAGAGWRVAFFVENIVLALSLVGLIEAVAVRLTGSRLAARLTPVVFLFSGGFGFINFFSDLKAASSFFEFLGHLPRPYTMNMELATSFGAIPVRWGNAFTTLIIPQRSMLFGLPLVSLILTFWWMALKKETEAAQRRRLMLTAGLLAGFLPLLHAHSFFAIMIVAPALVLVFWFQSPRNWIAFFVPAIVIAAPQALFLSGTPVRSHLFRLHFGWESGAISPVLFWLANAGPFILLLIAALGSRGLVEAQARRFYLAFILWFAVPNLLLLAPWPWDNIKVLISWSLVSSPFVAAVLADGFRRNIYWRIASAVLLVILTFSGVLDVMRALSPVEKATLYGRAEQEAADLIRTKTAVRSVILHAPIHNSVLTLAGRQSFMGYPGHLWTHGIDYHQREIDLQKIYAAGPEAKQLIKQYGIDYLLVGPVEHAQLRVDDQRFVEYPVVFDHSGYRLYAVRP